MTANKPYTLLLLILLGYSTTALSQDVEQNTIITDRPDATESPNTVPNKNLQIETGSFYTAYNENGISNKTFGYNTTLLRYGLLKNLEFRLGWNIEEERLQINKMQSIQVSNGFSPLMVGAKIAIVEEDGWLPTIGLLGHLYLPFTASKDYKTESTGVDFRFSFAHTLSEKVSVAYNIGGQYTDDSTQLAYVYTLAFGYSLTSKLSAYAEVYGDIPEDDSANHYCDAGLTFLVQNNFQLDATIGRSITKGQDFLVSAGFSYRIPN